MNIGGVYGKTIGGIVALGVLTYFGGSALKNKFNDDVDKKATTIKKSLNQVSNMKRVIAATRTTEVKKVVKTVTPIAVVTSDIPEVATEIVTEAIQEVVPELVSEIVPEIAQKDKPQVDFKTDSADTNAIIEANSTEVKSGGSDPINEDILASVVEDPKIEDVSTKNQTTSHSKTNNKTNQQKR